MVAVRFSRFLDRLGLAVLAAGGAGLAVFGPLLWRRHGFETFVYGLLIVTWAVRGMRAKRTIVDQTLARAVVRLTLVEGTELGPQKWSIDGQRALEINAELRDLQNHLYGPSSPFGERDAAREALIAQYAGPHLSAYLGPFTPTESVAWTGAVPQAQLVQPEPVDAAEPYEAGQPWPTLGPASAPAPWPTLPPHEKT